MAVDRNGDRLEWHSARFLLNSVSYDDKAWYIANRGPSDHEAIANVAGAGRRGTSEPTTAAIGKVS